MDPLAINIGKVERYFKSKERNIEVRVRPPYVVRLDGVGFSKAMGEFSQPRDIKVHKAIVDAAIFLLNRYSFNMGYVFSDEINLFTLDETNPFGGRVQKIVSVFSGFASAICSVSLGKAVAFDARVITLDRENDAEKYVIYRARISFNNLINKLIHIYGLHIEGEMKLRDRVKVLSSTVNIEELPVWMRWGSSLYWRLNLVEGVDSRTGKKTITLRRKIEVSEGYKMLLEVINSPGYVIS